MKHALDAKRTTKTKKVLSKMLTNKERDEDAMRSRLRFSSFEKFWTGVSSVLDVQNKSVDPELLSLLQQKDVKSVGDSTVFLPHSPYKIAWDIFLGVIIMYSVVMVPFQIGFQIHFGHTMFILEQVINGFFFTDIILTFNTAIVDHQGKLVFDRTLIGKKYLQCWFWIDVISTFPFSTLSGGMGTLEIARLFRLMRLLKLFRLLKLSKVGKQFDSLQINPALISIGNLIMELLLVSHLMACFWFFITTDAVQTDKDTYTWVKHIGMDDSQLFDKYVASFYWCITTILSIGYGDVVPVNSGERVFCICAELTGGIIFGAVISQVTRLIETRNPQAKAFKAKMDELKAYLGEKSLPRHLKTKAKNAYTYYLIRKSSFAESGIFDDLPKDMLGKLVNNIYCKEINGIAMFHAYNQRFVIQMVMHSQPSQAVQGDIICNCGDVADELIFLLHGVIRISLVKDGQHTVIAGYGSDSGYVGDFEFHKKSTRIADYTAILSCSIITIPYDVVTDMATEHADSYDQFEDEIKGRYERFMDVNNLPFSKKRNRSQSSRLQEMIRGVGSNEPMVPHSMQDQMYEFDSMWIDGEIEKTDTRFSQAELSKVLSHLAVKSCRVLVFRPPTTPMGKQTTSLIDLNQQDFNDRHIIHPSHWAKTSWDFFVGILIIYSVLTVPVQIAFGLEGNATLDWIFIGFFFVDMCFGFRTAYLDEEEDAYVVLPSMIYSRYLRSWFIIDFVSFFPFSFVLQMLLSSTSAGLSSIKLLKTVRLIRLVRLVRLAKLGHYLAKIEDQIGLSPAVFNLLNMLMQVLFIAHMVACVWWGLSSTMAEKGWMDDVLDVHQNIREATVEEQYIVALYWTTTTLATVGYGDITSTNTYERLLNIIIMILGATIFGYIVANVSNQMNSMNQASARLMERVTEVVEYLNEKNCPKYLSNSIVRHFKNKFNEQSVFDEVQILGRLPLRLHHEIRLFQHKEILSKIPIFKLIKNKSIIIYVFNLLDMSYYEPGQYLIRQNDLGNDLCFLTDGTAHVYQKIIVQKKYNQTKRTAKQAQKFVKRQGSIIGSVGPTENSEQQNISVIRTFANMIGSDNDSSMAEKRKKEEGGASEMSSKKTVTSWESYVNMDDNIGRRGGKYMGNLNSGDFVGHVALMTQSRHAASVCASTACTVYLLSRSDVGKVCYEQKDIALQLQAVIGKAIRNLEDNLGKNHVRIKRAAYLFNIRKGYFNHIGEEREKKRRRIATQQSKGYLAAQSSKAVSILKKVASSAQLVDLRASQKDKIEQAINNSALPSMEEHQSWYMTLMGYHHAPVQESSNIQGQATAKPTHKPAFFVGIIDWLKYSFYWVLFMLRIIDSRMYHKNLASIRVQPESPTDAEVSKQNRVLTADEKKKLSPTQRRWNIIREAILNAKAEAVVMRMKMANRRAETDMILGSQTLAKEELDNPFATVEGHFNHNSRDVDYFTRALRTKVGMVSSGSGAAFNDSNLAYDSDSDMRPLDKITQASRVLRRCSSSPWLVPIEAPALSSKRKIALLNVMQNRIIPSSGYLDQFGIDNPHSEKDDFITNIANGNVEESSAKKKASEGDENGGTVPADGSVSSDESEATGLAIPVNLVPGTASMKTIYSPISNSKSEHGGDVATLFVSEKKSPKRNASTSSENLEEAIIQAKQKAVEDSVRRAKQKAAEEYSVEEYRQRQSNRERQKQQHSEVASVSSKPEIAKSGESDTTTSTHTHPFRLDVGKKSFRMSQKSMMSIEDDSFCASKSLEYNFTKRAKRQRRYSFPSTNVSINWVADNKDQLVI